MKKSDLIFILFLLVLFIVINWNAINSFFSQDDFYHLRQVVDKDYKDFFTLFLPWNEIGFTFYRPLSREVYNFLMLKTFGLNPLPFHIVIIFLISANAYLLNRLVGFFTKSTLVRYLAISFFILNPVHNVELYYLSSIQTIISTFFAMLSFVSYINFINLSKKKFFYFSVLFFGLAAYSHESAIVLFPILFLTKIYLGQNHKLWNLIKDFFREMFWFGILLIPRLLIYFLALGLPKQDVYQPSIAIGTILNTLSWYLIWSFGLPEILVDFMNLKFKFNPNFFRWYSWYSDLIFPISILSLGILGYLIILVKKDIRMLKIWAIFLLFYLCTLIPFAFFPNHKFVYYLSFPIIFMSILIGFLIDQATKFINTRKLIIFVMLFNFCLISLFTEQLNGLTHWAAKRGRAAKVLISSTMNIVPKPTLGSLIYFKNDPSYPVISKEWGTSSKQAFYILSGSDALQLYYNDPSLKVDYEDVKKDNLNYVSKTYTVVAKFPY